MDDLLWDEESCCSCCFCEHSLAGNFDHRHRSYRNGRSLNLYNQRLLGRKFNKPAAFMDTKMSKSVNKVTLIGHLGQDPNVKYTTGGKPVAKFSLATTERYKDNNGEWQDRAEWHNIVAWEKLAELSGEYLKKGSKLYLEGRLQTSSWEDRQSGEKKYRTEIIANELVFLSSNGNGNGLNRDDGGHAAPPKTAAPAKSAPFGRSPQTEDFDQSTQITDDDIPF